MEEATMSQPAELTAPDNLEAADLRGAPTQSVKKTARFSADAFRALSSRLNGAPTPNLVAQPDPVAQPDLNGQVIPEASLEPSAAPTIELSVQPAPTIAVPNQGVPLEDVPIDGLVNGTQPVVAELPLPTAVAEPIAPVLQTPSVLETVDVAQAPQLFAEQALENFQAPIVANVPSAEEHVENSIPQFDVPQVEIPTFSAPDISDSVYQDAVQPEPELTPTLPEQALPEQAVPEQAVPEQILAEVVTVEQAPLVNEVEPDFLDLAQFTQDEPSSHLDPTGSPTPLARTSDQAMPHIEQSIEVNPSPSTNVGSLSLAEMLAAERQAVDAEPNTIAQTAVDEAVVGPADAEPIQASVDASFEIPAASELATDEQIETSQTVEPTLEALAAPIEAHLQEAPTTQAEPSLDDLFAHQAPPESQQPSFQLPTPEQNPELIASQPEIQPEQPVEIEPQNDFVNEQSNPPSDLHFATNAQALTDDHQQTELQAPTPAVQTPIQETVPDVVPDVVPDIVQNTELVIEHETAQETAPVSIPEIEPESIPAQVPVALQQDVEANDTDPSVAALAMPDQKEPVSENDMATAQLDVAPLTTSQVATEAPKLEADFANAPSFSPQSGVDPLLEAMRLMQEVGSTPFSDPTPIAEKNASEIAVVERVAQVPENVADQTKVAEITDEDALVSEMPQLDEAVPEATPNITTKTAPAASVEKAETDIDPDYELELEPDEKSGETARALLDMMSGSGGAAQPQERALAGDTLLQLVPRMPERDLISLSERVGMMEEPPALLVNKLINNRSARVAQPLLEGGQVVSDQDLLKLIKKCEVDRLTMISKRRQISSGVCDALIARGDASVYLTLVRNPGALISHDAFIILCGIAKNQQTLQAPLATRGDTPPPIAFELFWALPVELRRYVLSRFLTDSATLDKILKIAQSMDSDTGVEAAGDQHFPTRRKVDELVDLIAEGVIDSAVDRLANLAEIHPENARRIITDPDGEPLTVALKTLGISRAKFNKAIKSFSATPSAPLSAERDLQELQAMFDGLSHNKARTLMKYWDWAIEKSGPYARRTA